METINVSNLIVVPKHYIVTKTTQPITIDGKASEKDWAKTSYTDSFIDIEGIKQPKYNTQVKMLWDDTYLYVYAELEEPHVWATLKQRDTIIFYNNDFEIFIDPSNTTKNYGEIEINAFNTVWDLHLDKPYRVSGKPNNHWDLKELKSAVNIQGTINNPKDTDTGWTVEIAIPLKAISELKGSHAIPKEGEQWRLNFSRVEWDYDLINGRYYRKKKNSTFLPEYNWVWSNQKVINMHEPEKWGYIQFTEKTSAKNVPYKQEIDLKIKQTAYALFRETKFNSLKKLQSLPAETKRFYKVTYDTGKTVNAEFIKTNIGFEFVINSNETAHTYVINEEGILNSVTP
ncbi:carbohydrate-binding family 9-like protein [Neptunitalea chrysea]|nr:carbohydrate-binding family 9-like protein [Neptunitalea chrysea]